MGVTVSFRQSGLKRKLPQEISTAAFRIVQEALTNCVRYAGADSATVSVRAIKSLLTIRVEDRGKGFEVAKVVNGTSSGLSGIRERALMLGGKAEIDSHPGLGTTVTAEIPLPPTGKRNRPVVPGA